MGSPIKIDTQDRPYVRLTFTIWPSIYEGCPVYPFPTEQTAHLFALKSISSAVISKAEVYSMDDVLLWTYLDAMLGAYVKT